MSRVRLLVASSACVLFVVGVPVVAQARTLYVPTGNSTVATIDTATNIPGTPLTFPGGSSPWAAAFSPNGATAYILESTPATVTPVSVATGALGTPIAIPGGNNPEDLAITPNGNTAYVANVNGNTVVPIDLATNTAGPEITLPAGSLPQRIAITPDGATAYVADYGTNSVTPINLASNTAGPSIAVGTGPVGVAITPDGKTVYVTNNSADTVTPISTATNTAGTPIPTVASPGLPAIVPDQGPSAAFTATQSGASVSFNASGSTDPDGSVASYSWSFGDGTSVTTSAPTITHTYARGASYPATLTVTDNEGCSTTVIFTGHTVSCHGMLSAARFGHGRAVVRGDGLL